MKRLFGTCLAVATCSIGCSTDVATEADYDDVAQALTSVVVTDNGGGEIGSMVDSTSIAVGAPDLSIKIDAGGKYTGTHLGLAYEYSVNCGAAKCDRNTDSADVKIKWSGELMLPYMTSSVEREGTWKLSGIQSGVVNIGGASDFTIDTHMQSIFRTADRTYHLSYSADYAGVQLDRLTHRLSGGTISYEVDAERMASSARGSSEAEFHMSGVLAFSPSGGAALTLDGKYSYAIDTTTGFVVKK